MIDRIHSDLWQDEQGTYSFWQGPNEIRYRHKTGEHWVARQAEYDPQTHSLRLLSVIGEEVRTLHAKAGSDLDQRWLQLAQDTVVPVVRMAGAA